MPLCQEDVPGLPLALCHQGPSPSGSFTITSVLILKSHCDSLTPRSQNWPPTSFQIRSLRTREWSPSWVPGLFTEVFVPQPSLVPQYLLNIAGPPSEILHWKKPQPFSDVQFSPMPTSHCPQCRRKRGQAREGENMLQGSSGAHCLEQAWVLNFPRMLLSMVCGWGLGRDAS